MRSADFDTTVTALKRNNQWRLRGGSGLPEALLLSAWLPEEDLELIFSGAPIEGITVVSTIQNKQHKSAVVRFDGPDASLCQIYTGKLIRSTKSVLGRIGCVQLICERISDQQSASGNPSNKISVERLAEYIFPDHTEAGIKFFGRLNSGQPVGKHRVMEACAKLLLDTDDVVFYFSMIYKNRKSRFERLPVSLWAERLGDVSSWLRRLTAWDAPSHNIFFKLLGCDNDSIRRDVGRALGSIYDSVVQSSMATQQVAREQILNALRALRNLGFDCWVSYREGLQTGEPDERSKLFLTIGKIDSIGRTVEISGYVRFSKNIYYDRLPRMLPYVR